MDVQNQDRNQNTEEGSIRVYKVVFDNEGKEIDLNKPYNINKQIDEN